MDPKLAFSDVNVNFGNLFGNPFGDYIETDNALRQASPEAIDRLLGRKALISPDSIHILWNKFPEIAIKHFQAYSKLVKHCPIEFIIQNIDNTALICSMLDSELEIEKADFVKVCADYPEAAGRILTARPALTKLCPEEIKEQLAGRRQCEPAARIIIEIQEPNSSVQEKLDELFFSNMGKRFKLEDSNNN